MISNGVSGPTQLTPLLVKIGVTDIDALTGKVPALTPEKTGILPEPVDAKPIELKSLVQLYEVVPLLFSVVNVIAVVSKVLDTI